MISEKIILKNPTGLNIGPAGVLCREAVNFECSIQFQYRDGVANAKSILSVLGSGVKSGEEITFICSGQDENEALERMLRIVAEGLGE